VLDRDQLVETGFLIDCLELMSYIRYKTPRSSFGIFQIELFVSFATRIDPEDFKGSLDSVIDETDFHPTAIHLKPIFEVRLSFNGRPLHQAMVVIMGHGMACYIYIRS
jgi:hypothetical protein